jgi:hypothetical protein
MVGHIMRLAAYLSASRHDIFYFRWPIPANLHPARKRTHVKVSLGTRSPVVARNLSRVLVIAGRSRVAQASVRVMRFDEIREYVRAHFRGLSAREPRRVCRRLQLLSRMEHHAQDLNKFSLEMRERAARPVLDNDGQHASR